MPVSIPPKSPSAGPGAATPCVSPAVPCPHPVVHAQLRVSEITFSDNHVVERDTLGNFSSPEWKSSNPLSDNAPVCYTRNSKIKMAVKFMVVRQPTSGESVDVKGVANVGSISMQWLNSVSVNPGDTEVTVSGLMSDVNLSNEVNCYDPVNITWTANAAATNWSAAGLSSHVVYVVLADPVGTPVYWTLADISCRAAAGKSNEDDFVSASFRPFHATTGDGKGFIRKRDGKELTYYKQGAGTPSTSVFTCEDLLSRSDGTARCGAWARFLVAMHKMHGITSSSVFGVVPVSAPILIVKNCTFIGAGSLVAPFKHKGNLECVKNNGIFGQGKNNPQFIFGDHALVKHSTGIYDPSYGVGPEPNLKTWIDKGIAGIGELPPISFTYDGDPHFITSKCSPGFIKHTVAPGETLMSISNKYGIASMMALYNHTYNSTLKALRSTPSSVNPGDTVFIPRDISSKVEILKVS